MTIAERVPLSSLTTFKVGGEARYVLTCESIEDIQTALAFTRERGLPFVVLGEGSNVLPSDDGYPGTILLMRMRGISEVEQGDDLLVTAGAGESWEDLVRYAASKEWWGVENLAGIPGTVGAAPVQNIGAYGMELAHMLDHVEAFDTKDGVLKSFDTSGCGFGYRDSRFKHEPALIITSVTLRLQKNGTPRIDYADLRAAAAEGKDLSSPSAIGTTVREVRSRKFPDLREYGTAGSFFKNPILSHEEYELLTKRYQTEAEALGGIPSFPLDGNVKIPLAFILDKLLGLRGYEHGTTFLFGNQPLVLVAKPGATASDVEALAHDIEERVHDATGITIEREVRFVSAHEAK